ncbi:MAG: V-type ATP synthase subunit D [Actinobacteria bacterium]|nr:V-type ATP synthase subunit D [Actinomycetota bacterium]MCG2807257.1 V-type ATP synthase subunit D [Coriobacteriia bacterium]
MTQLRVNPNRMELMKLRRRKQVAERGHKLLKDKLDELMKEFLARIGETRKLRSSVERELAAAYGLMAVSRGESGRVGLAQALAAGSPADLVSVTERNVMSVRIPEMVLGELGRLDDYSLASTPAVLDSALGALAQVAPRLVLLAQREKAIELLAVEIERTRRRVNALEHVLIPQLVETIRAIGMKLDEAERSNLTRLMKVKEMIAAQEAADEARS